MKMWAICLLAILSSACGIEQVDEGFRGIETKWGKVAGDPLVPGLYFYNPVSSDIFELSVREDKLEGETSCFTKDTQTVNVKYVVTFFPDPKYIGKLYSQFGKGWQATIIQPSVLGSMKDAIGQYIADDLVAKREAVKQKAQQEIKTALAERNVTVTRLDITNLDFDNAYEQAVEDKVVAIQKAQEAKNKTVQVKEEAEQTIAKAKADAESMRIKSQALSQNKNLIGYEWVQKWNGALPTIVMGDKTVPMVNLGTLSNQ